MKNTLLLFFLFALALPVVSQNDTLASKNNTLTLPKDSLAVKSQVPVSPKDTLVLRNSSRMPAQIIEINPETVRYKKAGNEDGPTYTTYKSEIRYILFKNGVRETMDTVAKSGQTVVKTTSTPGDMYRKGTADAKVFYTHHSGEVGVGIASVLTGIVGIIPAIIVSAVPPHEKNLGYPSYELWKNKDYQAGYKRQAKKRKQKKVWAGFGIGFVSSLILVALLNQ